MTRRLHLLTRRLAAGALVVLLLSTAGIASAQAPTVNGLFYGDGDNTRYVEWNTSYYGSKLYTYFDRPGTTLYVALVVDPFVNDNVFTDRPPDTAAYMSSVAWGGGAGQQRDAATLTNSEFASFTFACDQTSGPMWTWAQAYGCAPSPSTGLWASRHNCGPGFGTPPPTYNSTSSFAWNINNYRTKYGTSAPPIGSPPWNMYVYGTAAGNWKSPFASGSPTVVPGAVSPAVVPPYSATYEWEWRMVFEWSVNIVGAGCGPNALYLVTGQSHHSPMKADAEGDFDPICGLENDCFPPPPPGGSDPLADFGDLPDSYLTLKASGGPRHLMTATGPYLGQRVEIETDGTPTATATGDGAEEDGVTPVVNPGDPWNPGDTQQFTIVSSGPATLGAWIDWNADGDFTDVGEYYEMDLVAGSNTLNATVGPLFNYSATTLYARFRVVSADSKAPGGDGWDVADWAGLAGDGEVEDYRWNAGTLPVTVAFVASERDGDEVAVRWTTASAWAAGGFTVWGRGAGARSWQRLAEVDAHTPDSLTPQRYEASVVAPGVEEILIEDVSLFGERVSHGPFAVGETVGEEPEARTIDWAAVKAEAGLAPPAPGGAARMSVRAAAATAKEGLLLVREAGIHRVTHEQLLAAGIDLAGTPADRIDLYNNGVRVTRFVAASNGTFGPGSFIEFVGQPALTLASPVDAYVLKVGRTRPEPPAALPAGGGALQTVTAEERWAPDRVYSFSSPNGDPWFDQGLLARGAAARLTRTFDLPDLAAGNVKLTVEAWGYGDWAGTAPDHHLIASVNGTVVLDERFDGITPLEKTVNVRDLVSASGNTLEILIPGDTGYQFDYVAFEGFSVSYPRRTIARNGRFAGSVTGGKTYAVGGFDAGETVALWRQKGRSWQRGEQTAAGGQVTLPTVGSAWAAATRALLVPEIVAGVPAAQQASSAQYVIVTHPALAGAAADLVAIEQARGFTTELVTTDRIYAAYSDHAVSADALKRFLTASAKRRALKYVLLVGADTTDPYNHLGLGSMTFVPTAYLPYAEYVTYSPTDEVLVDGDGDGLGDVPIGRLPVRTPAEVQAAAAKILAWEQNVAPGGRTALLASGSTSAFAPIARAYADALPSWTTGLAHVHTQGTTAVRATVLAALNAGTPVVSFVGHSSIGQWDRTPLLTWADAAALTNAGRPDMVVQWGCWNAYYVEPNVDSLSAWLLRTPGVGAAAVIGATTLTTEASHMALGTLFYQQLNGSPQTLGDAFRAAKVMLLGQPGNADAILGMAFLGDPAMSAPH